MICKECEFYSEDDLTGLSPQEKLDHVSGHCMDSNNPDFNEWARTFGRGITREDSLTNPKWCGKLDNPEKTEEYYTKQEINEAVKEAKEHRKFAIKSYSLSINDMAIGGIMYPIDTIIRALRCYEKEYFGLVGSLSGKTTVEEIVEQMIKSK